ncbi:dynamin family protein [Metabacillus herbersteinensis]|uniref:Dynamin family protein n=1 Tax=Metabacillus herbersteinensis TaxID=283816 RepID=A0ABV6GDB4_9BACI
MATVVSTQKILEMMISLHQLLTKNKDENSALKVKELIIKVHKEKKYIAFAGHFSAGKSTMINKLLGEQILPTSPIPTSANIVMLEKGSKNVQLQTSSGEVFQLEGDYSVDEIKEFCKQGDDIERVHIINTYKNLSAGIVIMDTPGIDSTDAAHRLSTESMLHIADVIFYVTDYNHVQSEENLSFIKEMRQRGKTVYLIVNQIDKHRSEEMSFQQYKQQIQSTFEEYGLKNTHIFYTTLLNDSEPNNEIEKVKRVMKHVIEVDDTEQHTTIKHALTDIVKNHLHYYGEQLDLAEINEEEVVSRLSSIIDEESTIHRSLKEEEMKVDLIFSSLKEKITTILRNANLTPFETREKAAAFIQSHDPSFKKGFLFTKGKTEQEREKRADMLYEDLNKRVETEITWHILHSIKEAIKENNVNDAQLNQNIQSFSIEFQKETLGQTLKKGASFNDQYTLTFSADLSDTLKKKSKTKAMILVGEIVETFKRMTEQKSAQFTSKLNDLKQKISFYNEVSDRIHQYEQHNVAVQLILTSTEFPRINLEEWLKEHKQPIVKKYEKEVLIPTKLDEVKETNTHNQTTQSKKENLTTFIHQVKKLSNDFKHIPGFGQFGESIIQKANRFENRTFTVALFGAFSAGKSSFANALIGEKLLPSSPTPTTATINKIAPPTSEKEHGLVEVILKKPDVFLNEMIEVLPKAELKGTSIQEVEDQLVEYVNKSKSKLSGHERATITMYERAIKTYKSLTETGYILLKDRSSFTEYVANEEKACMVEEVIIYFDCKITQLGITLVDTPGADSFNTRHTDVAFQYIKNADAILYVTYYNHPFSKGDREFIRQLGRVKDAFTLDKMFFIINAVDLAINDEEVAIVKNYIINQLLQQEVRNARLYGISSLKVLEGENLDTTDFSLFEEKFHHFIEHDLSETTILSIKEELHKTLHQIKTISETAAKDSAEKEREMLKIKDEQILVENQLNQLDVEGIVLQLRQEIEELIFYIKQRLTMRFSEFFKEAFHPGALKQGINTQDVLKSCLSDFVKSIQFELVQELQATSLRIEKFMGKQMDEEYNRIENLLQHLSSAVHLSKQESLPIESPTISIDFSNEQENSFRQSLKLYKNPRAFFEKNEKQHMIEDLIQRFDEPIQNALSIHQHLFSEYYSKTLMNHQVVYVTKMKEQTKQSFQSIISIYTTPQDLTLITEKKSEIKGALSLL